MKKILHLITGIERGGGAENMLFLTLPYLEKTENRVCVLKGEGELGKKLEEAGIKVYYLKMKNIFDWGVIGRYKKIIKDFAPDIQVNYLIHADFFGRIFAKKFGAKKVISYIRNRHINPLFVFLDRITLKKADYLLANSQSVLDFYRKKYKYPENFSACITNGARTDICLPEFDRADFKKSLGADENDFIITNVASLHKQKDQQTLIGAVRILKDSGVKDFKVFLVGDGREKEMLIKMANELDLKKEIVFLGLRKDVERILAITDLFVLASHHEGMSNALLEAMNFGRSCLVSDILENKELVNNGENGLIFKTGDQADLAEKISYLKDNPEKRAKFGAKAEETIKEKYDIKKIREKLDLFFCEF